MAGATTPRYYQSLWHLLFFLLGQVALQGASTLNVTSWSQDSYQSSNHQDPILGGRKKEEGEGCWPTELAPFKGDFLGTPPKKGTTLAFTSLTRIHGAGPI